MPFVGWLTSGSYNDAKEPSFCITLHRRDTFLRSVVCAGLEGLVGLLSNKVLLYRNSYFGNNSTMMSTEEVPDGCF